MLSRAQYRGRLPYEEYVRRYKLRTKINRQNIEQMPQQAKEEAKERAKKAFHEAVKNQTGIDTDDLSKAYDDFKGKPRGPKEDRTKQEIITGIAMHRAVIPNTEELNDVEQERAKMAKASKIAYLNDDNFKAAQDYMNDNNLGEIDTELSDSSGIVVKRPNGKVEIHYRGTQITQKPNYEDLITDAGIITGTEQGIPIGAQNVRPKQMVDAETQLQRALAKYGAGNVEHLGGYSRGGGIALGLGNKYNINTTTFNPLVGPKAVQGSYSTTADHTVIRTTEDPTTAGMALANPNTDRWTVKSMLPLKEYQSNIPLKNVYDAHKLDNFTKDGPRKTAEAEIDKARMASILEGQKHGERVQLKAMRKAIEDGKSFTEYMSEDNSGDVKSTPQGKRLTGFRIFGNDPYTEGWLKMGGRFTEGEAKYANDVFTEQGKTNPQLPEHNEIEGPGTDIDSGIGAEEFKLRSRISQNDSRYKLSNDEIKKFRSDVSNDDQLDNIMEEGQNDFTDAMTNHSEIEGAYVEHNTAAGGESGMRAANGTNLALGYLIGMGVDKGLDLIPGVEEFGKTEGGRPTMDIAKGGITGALSFAGASALGTATAETSAALAPEIAAGAAGFVAGDYSAQAASKAIKKIGGSKDDQDAAGNVVGGGVGGATAGLAAFGTAAAADALLGTELGSAFGPGGMAVGAAIGTAAGIGATIYKQGVSGLATDVEDAGKGIVSGIKSIGSAISSWF